MFIFREDIAILRKVRDALESLRYVDINKNARNSS